MNRQWCTSNDGRPVP